MDASSSGNSPPPLDVHPTPVARPLPRDIMLNQRGPNKPSQQNVKARRWKTVTKAVKAEKMSQLIGDIHLTFHGRKERKRAKYDYKPGSVYRLSGEKSATFSIFQPPEVHVKNRYAPDAALAEGDAFRNHRSFVASRDISPQRIASHYVFNKTRDPGSFVSTYQEEDDATARAHWYYEESGNVQHRLNIAEIDISGLIPATLHGTMQTYTVVYEHNTLNKSKDAIEVREVKIPVWVRHTARPADGSRITIQQFYDSGTDMWLRGYDMRKTGDDQMNCGAADTHDEEWLCCGPVPLSRVVNVFPFDGKKLHREKSHELVKSTRSIEIYIWNFDKRIWEHNPDTTDYRPYRLAKAGDKRFDRDDGDEENVASG